MRRIRCLSGCWDFEKAIVRFGEWIELNCHEKNIKNILTAVPQMWYLVKVQ